MRKQQKQSELEKRIDAIKFIESLDQFKKELRKYARRTEFKHCSYTVKMKADDVIKIAQELEERLEFLKEDAEEWEALE